MFFECTALVRVEVEEKEYEDDSKSSSGKIKEEDPMERIFLALQKPQVSMYAYHRQLTWSANS
jgi:hypothetical protein